MKTLRLGLFATAALVLASQWPHSASCHDQPQQRLCQISAKAVDWTHWLVGRSGSAQFHFIDLLELLTPSRDRPL